MITPAPQRPPIPPVEMVGEDRRVTREWERWFFNVNAVQVTQNTTIVQTETSLETTQASLGPLATAPAPLSLALGGTAANLSATGGTSRVLKQVGVGASITVARLAPTDLTITPAVKVSHQVFTSSGTYTPSAGLLYCIAEGVGGGGAGGGAAASALGISSGGGGGAGQYARVRLTAAQIGASQTVTIPTAAAGGAAGNNGGAAGGDVTLGTLLVCKGGTGGGGGAANSAGAAGVGGSGGTGDLTGVGADGITGDAATITTILGIGGRGGSTLWGGSPAAVTGFAVATNGSAPGANAFGAGGGGGVSQGSAGTAAGGNGAKGVIIITEFTSQ